jgi:hypothetical protein
MSEISGGGFHDPKDGVSVNVVRGKVDQMRIRVNANCVSMGCEQTSLAHQPFSLLAKDAADTHNRFKPESTAGGEHVGVFPDRMCRPHLHGGPTRAKIAT